MEKEEKLKQIKSEIQDELLKDVPEMKKIEKLRYKYECILSEQPRRIRLDLNTPAELAIHNAIKEVEKIGADIKLTEAINLLEKAKELVADYVDEKL